MSAVCDQDIIEISPKLANMFRRHFDKDYSIDWFVPVINRYVNREQIKSAIRKRYLSNMRQHNIDYSNYRKRHLAEQDRIIREAISEGREPPKRKLYAADKFISGAIEFLNDFDSLDFADIDVLRRLTQREAMMRPIRTINGNEIKFMED